MSDEAESLVTMLSFLSQFDLPLDLETEGHGNYELLLPDDDLLNLNDEEFLRDQLPVSTEQTNEIQVLNEELIDKSSSVAVPSGDSAILTEEKSAATKFKRKRISRKQQIEDLHRTVQELLAELGSTTPHWRKQDNRVQRPKLLWEDIALRQLDSRQESEKENANLREMINVQLQEAKNLKRLLKRRTKIEMMEEMLGVKKPRLQFADPAENPQVFEDMLQDIDELYAEVDAVFSVKGLYNLPCPGRKRVAKPNISDGLFMELMQRVVVPFGIRETEKAVWKALTGIWFQGLKTADIAKHARFHAYRVGESNNTMKISFFAEVSGLLQAVKGAAFRAVVRKYVENDRVVFVYKSLLEPILFEKTTGFHTRTTLRIIVHEDKDGSEALSVIDSLFSATRYDDGLPSGMNIRALSNMNIGVAACP
ncbi:hypothetical protein PHYBOEH_007534 [Phytophthora boehmeriae]|uniref:M96 mating-specific protein family n=1 Tax=Phytophthora boehmeriae TaxID=109152 RepID=A0A8T1WBC0_9STRA|nr:hypothetical protein PHYBOEH_007534 [Phytophthora boehmeriae]